MKLRLLTALTLSLAPLAPITAQADPAAAPPPAAIAAARVAGGKLFAARCATCHGQPGVKAPSVAQLGDLSVEDIAKTLLLGKMAAQAQGLNLQEVGAIAMYLSHKAVRPDPDASANLCKTPQQPTDLAASGWNGWGVDAANTRFQPNPGFAAADIGKLKLKWAFSYTGAMVYGQPTIIGGRVFVTSQTGRVQALNAQTGCTIWTAELGAATRTAITVTAAPPGVKAHAVAYLADEKARVHALDADTGAELWAAKIEDHKAALITGAPAVFGGRVYVGVASSEEVGASPPYPCCTFRGSVAALDAATGKQVWKTYTIAQAPKPYRKAPGGFMLYGPAGASVWSSPTIDAKAGRLYVGTGNSYSGAPTTSSDAVIAMNLKDGKVVWATQVAPDDNFVVGCYQVKPPVCNYGICNGPGEGDCPQKVGPDDDFGASPILRVLPNGKRVLLAGAKSAIVYGIDPDAGGKILWHTKVGVGGPAGGVEWGMAADAARVYAATSDFAVTRPDLAGGLTAIDIATGKPAWTAAPHPVCAWGKENCWGSQSQAVTALPGLVLSGSMDGHLRAYAAADGKVVWDYDAGGSFETVNQGKQLGGSFNHGGATVAGGMVFVNAGYGRFAGQNGHVLLAFGE